MGKTEHQEITLPYDMDAEQATLAGILHDPDQLESLRLKPGDFHHAMHKDIFRAMQSLQRQDLPLTWVRMHQEVCSLPGVEREPVSITYLSEVFDSALSSAHLADHAAVVKEKVRKRELILSMSKLTEAAAEPQTISLADLLAEEDEAEPWLVDHLLTQGGLSLLNGKPGAGKTTWRCVWHRASRGSVET